MSTSYFVSPPSNGQQRHVLGVLTVKPGKPLTAIICSTTIEGVFTHWDDTNKRTILCRRGDGTNVRAGVEFCEWCRYHRSEWKGFLIVQHPKTENVAMLRVTPNCVSAMAEQGVHQGNMAGRSGLFYRMGDRENSPLTFKRYQNVDKVLPWSVVEHQAAVLRLMGVSHGASGLAQIVGDGMKKGPNGKGENPLSP